MKKVLVLMVALMMSAGLVVASEGEKAQTQQTEQVQAAGEEAKKAGEEKMEEGKAKAEEQKKAAPQKGRDRLMGC